MVKKIQERPSDPAVPQDEFMRGMAEGMWIAMTLVSAMMGHNFGSPYKTVDVCDHGSAQIGEGMEMVDEVRRSDHTTILLPLSTMRAI